MISQRALITAKRVCGRTWMSTAVAREMMAGTPNVTPTAAGSTVVASTTLGNGTRVAAREAGNGISGVKICITAGASSESASEKGAAHLLSAAAFVGTANTSGIALIRELDNLGAKVGSGADRSTMTWDVTFPSENTQEVMDIVSAAVGSPPPTYKYIDAKSTAGVAYDALKSSPTAMLGELIFEAAYGEDSGMGSSMYAKALAGLDVDAVAAFRATHFKAGNLALVGTGVSGGDLSAAAENMGLAAGTTAHTASAFVGGEVRFKADYGNDSNVAIAFPAGADATSMEVLQTHIAGKTAGMPLTPFKKDGLVGFMASGAPTAVMAAMTAVMNEMKAVAGGASTADAIAAVGISKALATQSACATDALLDTVLKGPVDMSTVSATSVSAATAAALKTGPAYAMLGSVAGTPTLKSIS